MINGITKTRATLAVPTSISDSLHIELNDKMKLLSKLDSYDDSNYHEEKKKLILELYKIYPDDPEIKARYTVFTHLSNKQEAVLSKPRIDYFLIWGHGIKYADEILFSLRTEKNFKLLSITKHNLENIEDFVFSLYETDTVPWEHLIAKTRYLLTIQPEIKVIIVENSMPREKYFGDGEFRHIQCEKVKILKEIIRNKFNPHINGKRTEEHVIHASDYESQTEHLLKILGLNDLNSFKEVKNRFISIPYHLPKPKKITIKKVELNEIYCSIISSDLSEYNNEIVPIDKTPHFQYVLGNKGNYKEYFEKYEGILLTDDHNLDSFDNLINEFDYNNYLLKGNFILLEKFENKKYRVLDGVHRLAILERNKVTNIIAAICN